MYVVLGSTGNTGRVVVRELARAGAAVRAVARNAAADIEGAKEVFVADLLDERGLGDALEGAEGVYVMLPPRPHAQDMLEESRRMADAVAGALARAGTEHVVQLSSIGAHLAQDTGPILSNRHFERSLCSVAPSLTRIRAPYFMENWGESLAGLADGTLFTMLPPELSIPMVATEDIGVAAATALLEGPRGQRIIELYGPRAYSATDAAVAFSKLLGRSIRPAYVPPEAVVSTLVQFGIPEKTATLFRDMYRGVSDGHIVHEGGNATQVKGKVELQTVLRRLLAQADLDPVQKSA